MAAMSGLAISPILPSLDPFLAFSCGTQFALN
jgi:hypothetical protein